MSVGASARRPVLAVGVVAAVASVLCQQSNGSYTAWEVVASVAIGCTLVGAGVWLLGVRPHERMGGLLALAGICWWAENLQTAVGAPAVAFLGVLLSASFSGAMLHLALAFPTGRLRNRTDRALAGLNWGVHLVLVPLSAIVRDSFPLASGIRVPWDGPSWKGTLDDAVTVVMFATLVVVIGAAARHMVRASPGVRRLGVPVLAPAAALAVAAGTQTVVQPEFNSPGHDVLTGITSILATAAIVGFPLGVVRLRLARSAIAVALPRLASGDAPARDTLSEVLRDPALQLLAPGEGADRPVGPGRAVAPLRSAGRPVADLVVDEVWVQDTEILDGIGAALVVTQENADLRASGLRAAQAAAEQERTLRRVRREASTAADDARREVERNLHDGVQQQLLALALELSSARSRRAAGDHQDMDVLLDDAARRIADVVTNLRALARGTYPAALVEQGLDAAVAALVEQLPPAVRLDGAVGPRREVGVEAAAYFCVSEAVANALKHASASRVRITLSATPDAIAVVVRDDGCGGAQPAGSGLRGLRDRVTALGGSFAVESPAGGGTTVTARLPA